MHNPLDVSFIPVGQVAGPPVLDAVLPDAQFQPSRVAGSGARLAVATHCPRDAGNLPVSGTDPVPEPIVDAVDRAVDLLRAAGADVRIAIPRIEAGGRTTG